MMRTSESDHQVATRAEKTNLRPFLRQREHDALEPHLADRCKINPFVIVVTSRRRQHPYPLRNGNDPLYGMEGADCPAWRQRQTTR